MKKDFHWDKRAWCASKYSTSAPFSRVKASAFSCVSYFQNENYG